jgi:hypothetical protein
MPAKIVDLLVFKSFVTIIHFERAGFPKLLPIRFFIIRVKIHISKDHACGVKKSQLVTIIGFVR